MWHAAPQRENQYVSVKCWYCGGPPQMKQRVGNTGMIMWTASSYEEFHIRETLSINFYCVRAPSICVINKEVPLSSSLCSPVSVSSEDSLTSSTARSDMPLWRRSAWEHESVISCCLSSLSPISSISFSCDQTLATSSLKPRWRGMALILTFFLRGSVHSGKILLLLIQKKNKTLSS